MSLEIFPKGDSTLEACKTNKNTRSARIKVGTSAADVLFREAAAARSVPFLRLPPLTSRSLSRQWRNAACKKLTIAAECRGKLLNDARCSLAGACRLRSNFNSDSIVTFNWSLLIKPHACRRIKYNLMSSPPMHVGNYSPRCDTSTLRIPHASYFNWVEKLARCGFAFWLHFAKWNLLLSFRAKTKRQSGCRNERVIKRTLRKIEPSRKKRRN